VTEAPGAAVFRYRELRLLVVHQSCVVHLNTRIFPSGLRTGGLFLQRVLLPIFSRRVSLFPPLALGVSL
jgi:hypothetical protein